MVILFFVRPTSYDELIKKESVEMFVYLTMGIWRGLDENKQYSTPAQYGVAQNVPTYHTNTSDVSIRYPFV